MTTHVKPELTLTERFAPAAISAETRFVNERLAQVLANAPEPDDLAETRAAYLSGSFGLPVSPRSPQAQTLTIPGPVGEIALRVLVPDTVQGVYLHVHGGGWMLGANDTWDDQLRLYGEHAQVAAVSLDYRLAPEHPFPAGRDDVTTVARWLIDDAPSRFGTSWLAIGGESAGANLAAATLLDLRDEGRADAFRAANLMYGMYDLSRTPSMRHAIDTAFVNASSIQDMVEAYRGQTDVDHPGLSPLYADLAGLPPALFSVGTIDPLLDDSLFMHMRWQAARNQSHLAVYPGGVHGFNTFDSDIAQEANLRISSFFAEQIQRHGTDAAAG